jgi:hypothetical protein
VALNFNREVLMRFVVVILIFLGTVAYGQTDSVTRVKQDSADLRQPSVPGQPSPQLDEQNAADEVAVKLSREELPLFLQRALQEPQFRGWEHGNFYRNEESTKYKVEVIGNVSRKAYYFDKEGNLLRSE